MLDQVWLDRLFDAAHPTRRALTPMALKVALRIGRTWTLDQREILTLIELSAPPLAATDWTLTADQFYRAGPLIQVWARQHFRVKCGLTAILTLYGR